MKLTAKCSNFNGCLLAYRSEDILLAPDAPLICPECEKVLSLIELEPARKSSRTLALAASGILAVAAGTASFLWKKPLRPAPFPVESAAPARPSPPLRPQRSAPRPFPPRALRSPLKPPPPLQSLHRLHLCLPPSNRLRRPLQNRRLPSCQNRQNRGTRLRTSTETCSLRKPTP